MTCACQMGGGMLWAMALPVVVLGVLAVIGVLIVRALWHRVASTEPEASRALSLLEERFARGEIDQDEFTTRRQHLVDMRR